MTGLKNCLSVAIYLCASNEHAAIHAPRECEYLSSNVELRSACFASSVPESNSAIAGTACKLKLSDWVEQDLLDGMCMTSELNLAFWGCYFRIPDADRAIGGASCYQSTGGIPRYCAMAKSRSAPGFCNAKKIAVTDMCEGAPLTGGSM